MSSNVKDMLDGVKTQLRVIFPDSDTKKYDIFRIGDKGSKNYPVIIYRRVSGNRELGLKDSYGLERQTIQIDCISRDENEVQEMADTICNHFHGKSFDFCQLANVINQGELKLGNEITQSFTEIQITL